MSGVRSVLMFGQSGALLGFPAASYNPYMEDQLPYYLTNSYYAAQDDIASTKGRRRVT